MITELKQAQIDLSKEWKKPKGKNIKSEHDKRSPRDYEKIKSLHQRINSLKSNKK